MSECDPAVLDGSLSVASYLKSLDNRKVHIYGDTAYEIFAAIEVGNDSSDPPILEKFVSTRTGICNILVIILFN